MAKNLKVNGIVISENNSNDYDKMLSLLTPNLGKISCTFSSKNHPSIEKVNGSGKTLYSEK